MYVYLSAIDLVSFTGMTRIKRPPGAMVNDKIVLGIEAMTCMECFNGTVTWIRTGRLHQDLSWKNLNIKNSQFFFFFCGFFCCSIFLTFRSIRVSFLFARAYSKPFGKSSFRSFLPFSKFVLPCCFQSFGPENFSTTLIELFPVSICSGVSSTLILGEHVDCWRMSTSE